MEDINMNLNARKNEIEENSNISAKNEESKSNHDFSNKKGEKTWILHQNS